MYDNSKQHSAVLPLVLSTAGAALVGMVLRRLREDRAVARGEPAARGGRRARRGQGPARAAGRRLRGPVL